VPGNRTTFKYALQIANVFHNAGWPVEDNQVSEIYEGGTNFGVTIKTESSETGPGKAVVDAFRSASIPAEVSVVPGINKGMLFVELGMKPY